MGVDGQRHDLAALSPGKRCGANCVGGWAGHGAGLDGCVKSHSHRDSIPTPSSPYRVAILSCPTTVYLLSSVNGDRIE